MSVNGDFLLDVPLKTAKELNRTENTPFKVQPGRNSTLNGRFQRSIA